MALWGLCGPTDWIALKVAMYNRIGYNPLAHLSFNRQETFAMQIEVTKNPSDETLNKLGCRSWGIWRKEPSVFPWHYDDKETCLIIEGKVTVTPNGGEPVTFGKGDLVVFPQGMSCTWNVREAVRKYYKFGD
jgi:hypothetical protein